MPTSPSLRERFLRGWSGLSACDLSRDPFKEKAQLSRKGVAPPPILRVEAAFSEYCLKGEWDIG